jgi:hypothetical protein
MRPSSGAFESIKIFLGTTATLWTPQMGGWKKFLMKHDFFIHSSDSIQLRTAPGVLTVE